MDQIEGAGARGNNQVFRRQYYKNWGLMRSEGDLENSEMPRGLHPRCRVDNEDVGQDRKREKEAGLKVNVVLL